MSKLYYLISLIIFFIFGILFFAIQNDFIIFRWPTKTILKVDKFLSTKKSIKLFYWNNSKWINESIDILISGNLQDDVQRIIISWLNLLDEEKIIEKTSLQTVLISESSNELFLSFDRNLISEEISTYEKLMLIESLLKTLREAEFILTTSTRFARSGLKDPACLPAEVLTEAGSKERTGKITKINFLVYHKPMQDPHLDFSNPWPLQGFLKK